MHNTTWGYFQYLILNARRIFMAATVDGTNSQDWKLQLYIIMKQRITQCMTGLTNVFFFNILDRSGMRHKVKRSTRLWIVGFRLYSERLYMGFVDNRKYNLYFFLCTFCVTLLPHCYQKNLTGQWPNVQFDYQCGIFWSHFVSAFKYRMPKKSMICFVRDWIGSRLSDRNTANL